MWIPGIINKSRGPVSYSVKLTNGTIVKQHVDHVRRRQSRDDIVEPEDDFFYPLSNHSEVISVTVDEPRRST